VTYAVYVIRRVAAASLLALAALAAIYAIADLVEHARIVLAYRAPNFYLARLAWRHLPTALYQLWPVAIWAGSLATMIQMHERRETLALSSAGMTPRRRLLPFVALGFVATAAMYFLGETLVVPAEAAYRRTVDIAIKHKDRWGAKWRPHRLWTAGPSGVWRVEAGEGGDLHGVILYRRNGDGAIVERLQAERLTWRAGHWEAAEALRFGAQGRSSPWPAEDVARLPETPAHFTPIWAAPEEMTRRELQAAVVHRRRQSQDEAEYALAWWNRLAFPGFCLILPVLAVVSVGRRQRPRAFGRERLRMTAVGVLVALAAFAFVAVGRAAVLHHLAPPAAGAFAPLVFLAAATAIGWRVARPE